MSNFNIDNINSGGNFKATPTSTTTTSTTNSINKLKSCKRKTIAKNNEINNSRTIRVKTAFNSQINKHNNNKDSNNRNNNSGSNKNSQQLKVRMEQANNRDVVFLSSNDVPQNETETETTQAEIEIQIESTQTDPKHLLVNMNHETIQTAENRTHSSMSSCAMDDEPMNRRTTDVDDDDNVLFDDSLQEESFDSDRFVFIFFIFFLFNN